MTAVMMVELSRTRTPTAMSPVVKLAMRICVVKLLIVCGVCMTLVGSSSMAWLVQSEMFGVCVYMRRPVEVCAKKVLAWKRRLTYGDMASHEARVQPGGTCHSASAPVSATDALGQAPDGHLVGLLLCKELDRALQQRRRDDIEALGPVGLLGRGKQVQVPAGRDVQISAIALAPPHRNAGGGDGLWNRTVGQLEAGHRRRHFRVKIIVERHEDQLRHVRHSAHGVDAFNLPLLACAVALAHARVVRAHLEVGREALLHPHRMVRVSFRDEVARHEGPANPGPFA
eukprot:scaffold18065_cov111-Isochrysis_galbana.AAC.6